MIGLGDVRAGLVCLDLQRGRLQHAADGPRVAEACRRVLAEARRRRWPVLHVHHRGAAVELGRPIAGLEPLPSEPLFERPGPSAFSNRSFERVAQGLGGPLALMGFHAFDTVAATAFAAADRQIPVDLIFDAVATGGPSRLLAGVCTPPGDVRLYARFVSSKDLFPGGISRFAAANTP